MVPKKMVMPILLGSARQDRAGSCAAQFVLDALAARGHEPVLVDPTRLQLPLLDRMYNEHTERAPVELEELATLYCRVDSFLVVSAEYNPVTPPQHVAHGSHHRLLTRRSRRTRRIQGIKQDEPVRSDLKGKHLELLLAFRQAVIRDSAPWTSPGGVESAQVRS